MIKNTDFVIVGLQPWDIEIGSNCKNIALEISGNNRVLYVNPPLDRGTVYRSRNKPAIKKRLEMMRAGESLQQIGNNLWNLYPPVIIDSINWLPSSALYRGFNKLNNRKFAAAIKKAIEVLGLNDFILFNDSDMFRSFYLKELLSPTISVYYSRDNLLSQPYWNRHGKVLEPEIMAKSDLVVANSEYLAGVAGKYNSNSFYVGQGCDIGVFSKGAIQEKYLPADLKDIPGPVIGYIGAIINQRLDLELLIALCGQRQDWNFVFVGPYDETFGSSRLMSMPNVWFLGNKNEKELPYYLDHFDVAINPQRINPMTIGNYPRKIDEYLAMGKPVVATRTETMQTFRDYVHLADGVEDYTRLIEVALKETGDEILAAKRADFAAEHTWSNSVNGIYKAIERVRSVQPAP